MLGFRVQSSEPARRQTGSEFIVQSSKCLLTGKLKDYVTGFI